MASPARPTISMKSQRLPPTLNADLLREIFLRVASPSDLARVSAACVDFCRLIADPSFLRRYRSLHPPLLFGSISTRGLVPVTAPHPNAAAARDFAGTVDFSFRHLPHCASIYDIREGYILFGFIDFEKKRSLRELAVCNPLSRAYHLVPPIPDDLLASFHLQELNIIDFETFLAPSCDVEETSFRVIGCVLGKTRMVVFIFSSGSGLWSVGTSASWDALSLDEPQNPHVLHSHHHAYGCFYWKVSYRDKLIKLDMNTMKLSTHDFPPDHDERSIAIVEAGDGNLAMFSQNEDAPLNYYTFSQDGSKKDGELHIKSTVPLPSYYTWNMTRRQYEGHLYLIGMPKKGIQRPEGFLLEIKTFKVERLNAMKFPVFLRPYFGFPPIISPRRVQGLDLG